MNYDLGAVNWKQLAYIFMGWVLTLPCAGLISGLLCLMALNTPHFYKELSWKELCVISEVGKVDVQATLALVRRHGLSN